MPSELPRLHTSVPTGARAEYRAWLDELDDEVVGGAIRVAEAMPRVSRALFAGDPAVVDEARAVMTEVRDRCRFVDEQAFLLLAREAPVSGDLRRLMAIVRLITDLDRAATLVHHVGAVVERIEIRRLPEGIRQQLIDLSVCAIEVFRHGVDAWRRRDALAIHDVERADIDVDQLRDGLLLRARTLDATTIDVLVLGLLARYFERLADHGVAFAQQATFVVTGTRVAAP